MPTIKLKKGNDKVIITYGCYGISYVIKSVVTFTNNLGEKRQNLPKKWEAYEHIKNLVGTLEGKGFEIRERKGTGKKTMQELEEWKS